MTCDGSGRVDLGKSYVEAEKIMADKAVSFHHAFRNLPDDRFRGVAAVYAFCRTADDISDSDETISDPEIRSKQLDVLENALLSLYSESRSDVGWVWWPAFEDTVRIFDIPADVFLKQIKGQRMDLSFCGIKNVPELIEYCAAVAGSVGTMLLPMLASENARNLPREMWDACERLGIGMQITNILRDVGEDIRKRNRIYLPLDILAKHGMTRETLIMIQKAKDLIIPEEFISLWEELSALADTYYESYLKWLHKFHPDCRVPLVAAALNYHAIADAVRESGYDCFSRRNYTSAAKRDELMNVALEIAAMAEGK